MWGWVHIFQNGGFVKTGVLENPLNPLATGLDRKTSTDVRGRYMGVEEGTGKEIGGRRNENATMDVRSYEAGQDQK